LSRVPRRRLPTTLRCAALSAALLAAGCATDTIEDRRYGQQLVCHDGKTLTVSNADSFVHLHHGDTPGPCPAE
jgi:hypothetical protein